MTQIRLEATVAAWNTAEFVEVFQREVACHAGDLPLQRALAYGNHVADSEVTVMVIRQSETAQVIHIKAGLFFQSVIAGCSCADDPTPISPLQEYCELLLDVDKLTGVSTITLLD